MKKIIIYFFVIFLAAAFMAPAQNAYAEVLGQEGTIKAAKPAQSEKIPVLKDYTFDLSETLKTGDDQKQSWLWNSEKNDNGTEKKSPLIALLMKIISVLTYAIGSLALLTLIVSGLWLVTSHGEQSQIEKGKKILTYAMVGLGFAFASYIIITFVQSLLT